MKIVWDATGERRFETGLSHGVLYPYGTDSYGAGVAWNGLTSVSDSPEGAEASDLWADNIKYGSLRSAETAKGTIEAYTYPDEFAECDGSATPVKGVRLGQQKRKVFGFCYRTVIGNDTNDEAGYLLHIVYGATASPSQKQYQTINDSPEAMTFSWEYETTPISVAGYKPTATITIDSTAVDSQKLATLEAILYGKDPTTQGGEDGVDPRLPLPAEVLTTLGYTGSGS